MSAKNASNEVDSEHKSTEEVIADYRPASGYGIVDPKPAAYDQSDEWLAPSSDHQSYSLQKVDHKYLQL
mgnify:CR=1 FL=1